MLLALIYIIIYVIAFFSFLLVNIIYISARDFLLLEKKFDIAFRFNLYITFLLYISSARCLFPDQSMCVSIHESDARKTTFVY